LEQQGKDTGMHQVIANIGERIGPSELKERPNIELLFSDFLLPVVDYLNQGC
jgi:hypothetical protein